MNSNVVRSSNFNSESYTHIPSPFSKKYPDFYANETKHFMNRIDRLMGILTLLQTKKYLPAEKIAERFGISNRTVYRDIKALAEQGVPVSFEPAKGYFIVQGYFLPPVSFTNSEANALILMEALLHGFADNSIREHYTSALSKVKAVLKTGQKEQVDELNNHIRWQMPPCVRHDYSYLSPIQDAISAKTMLVLTYRNTKEETSQREVEPLGLVFYALNWHLIAWCHSRNDYRDFRVSRIVALEQTSLPFRQSNHIALGEYMQQLPVSY